MDAGVITINELKAFERAQSMTDYPCYWVPISWASNLVQQAYEQGYIKVDWLWYFGKDRYLNFFIAGGWFLFEYHQPNDGCSNEM